MQLTERQREVLRKINKSEFVYVFLDEEDDAFDLRDAQLCDWKLVGKSPLFRITDTGRAALGK